MALKPTIRFAVVGLLTACGARTAAAAQSAPADPVAAGYVRIYNGDREGGFKHFEALHAREPENLAQGRYRLAYGEFQRGSYDAAARGLEPIVASGAKIPRWLKAAATLNLGWTYDVGGRRAEAIRMYKKVVADYEDQAAAGAARLGLLTPYRPRPAASTS
jgi:tetratricopeptide (TPR) repeat protein